jgi:sugar phosphate isomerase/epimerase
MKLSLGAQLWTIREQLQQDLPSSLQKLAKLGYQEIELFGYNGQFWGKTPKEFAALCKDVGLTIVSVHYPSGRLSKAAGTLANGWQKAIDDAAAMNIQYMVCAWLEPDERGNIDHYLSLCDLLNTSAEACQKAGIQFAYHGHDFEFLPIDNLIPYDLILEKTNPELVKMETDLYWFHKAGRDSVRYFKQYPGRFPLWHLKDSEAGTGNFKEVGAGTIDFTSLFNAREIAGLRHCFVEQDECQGDPFDSLAKSRNYLASNGYTQIGQAK